MGVLTEVSQWEPTIRQIEVTDPVLGGQDGPVNIPAKQLANRTQHLKQKVDGVQSEVVAARGGKTTLAERIAQLETTRLQGESTFSGIAGKTVTHNIGHVNYLVDVMPLENTFGDMGDVFITKTANAFTVYNTGGFRGALRYQINA